MADGFDGESTEIMRRALVGQGAFTDDDAGDDAPTSVVSDQGVVTSRAPELVAELAAEFVRAIAMHRHWSRDVDAVPA